MIRILCALALATLAGCASLTDAGIARYTVEPYFDTVQQAWVCCRATVVSGKNVQAVHVKATKAADGSYSVELVEQGIDASSGQQISSQAASNVAGAVSKAASQAASSLLK